MAEVLQPRTPPHSIEAEQSVLGALLMDNAVHPDVAALVREPDFYSAEHRIIYRAIGELVAASIAERQQLTALVAATDRIYRVSAGNSIFS